MTCEDYLKIKGCKHQYVVPSMNTENVSVFCTKDVDTSKSKNVPPWRHCPECIGKDCKNRVWSRAYKEELLWGLTSKKITEDMAIITETNLHYWAFLYWQDELSYCVGALDDTQDEKQIEHFCHRIVEAQKLIVELYNKLRQMPDFDQELIFEHGWMQHFLD